MSRSEQNVVREMCQTFLHDAVPEYIRDTAYYILSEGGVQKINIQEGETWEAQGVIQGEDLQVYTPSLTFSITDRSTRHQCNCSESFTSTCRHVAALALRLLEELRKEQGDAEEVTPPAKDWKQSFRSFFSTDMEPEPGKHYLIFRFQPEQGRLLVSFFRGRQNKSGLSSVHNEIALQQIINKRFTIESGSSIQWTGSPMNAMLDIDAVYKVKASLQPLLQGTADLGGDRSVPVECIIHLGERLSNPTITFDVRVPSSDPETQSLIANALSTPETVDTQFLYLLLFNSFMSENSSQASSNIGSSVSAATGLEFVSNMVSNWLSSSDYNVVIRYRPKSELTSDEVDFGLSKSLINNRLFVEVEGNYLIDNKQAVNSSMSNFMGEAYIELFTACLLSIR